MTRNQIAEAIAAWKESGDTPEQLIDALERQGVIITDEATLAALWCWPFDRALPKLSEAYIDFPRGWDLSE